MSFRLSWRRWGRAFRPEPRRRPSVPRPSHTPRPEFLEYRVCPSTLIDATARVHEAYLRLVPPASAAAALQALMSQFFLNWRGQWRGFRRLYL
jgi:hypothetical protein